MSAPTTENPKLPKPRRVIGRQLALGFGLVSVVAVSMCGMLLTLIGEVSGLVQGMQHDEVAIRESLGLSMAVREQYIHQAHWIIERDSDHLHHYGDWIERIERGIETIRPLVPEGTRWRVDALERDSQELDRLFRESIVPATRREDTAAIVRLHKEADDISSRAAEHADNIAVATGDRMSHAHVDATRATTLGLTSGAACVLLVISLSLLFTARLRKAVVKPLDVLSHAARQFGSGNFRTRVGTVGVGELRAVGEAFDRMAEELEAREKVIVEKERMAAIGQLAAGVAHEINNPIQIIRGYLKTMGPDSSPEDFANELKIIDEEASACQRIAEDLVAYARTPELHRQPVSMKELIEESVRRVQETHDVDHPVEVSVADADVVADADRIRQVVLNLLLNASQVSEDGTPIDVTGRPLGEGGGYEIAVSDRGPGIDPEDEARIFEPFFSKRSGGSGLGLAVCRGIVQAHGGTLAAQPRPAGGSTFVVHLPASPETEKRS